MNILLYITALLAALSIVTYARLGNFINQTAVRQQTACYMGLKDRIAANEAERENYTSQNSSSKNEKKEPDKKQQITKATRKLNFIVFLNKQARDQNDAAYKTIAAITRQLLINLYGNERFFRKVQQSRGDAVEALLSRLIQISEPLDEESSMKDEKELISIDLQDPELRELLAKMLKGDSIPEVENCAKPLRSGYPSLLTFVDVKKEKILPIRIQLAPRELIEAIFIDPNTIEEVLTMRKQLQRQTGKMGSVEQQVASQQFERVFRSRIPRNLDPNMFDFTITTTAVKNK